MTGSLTARIVAEHLVAGDMKPGEEIALRVDQTLTQDATGTMAYLQFEALGVDRVRTELSVSYVDHNTLQTGFENADDHRYLQSVAAHYGVCFSRPGNGICHQVHLERFGLPGKTLLGSDSHTPTAGGLGMIAIGVGGLDVAAAMAGEPFYLTMPSVIGVELTGELTGWASAKDVILELLRRLSVKAGVGKVFEYFGPGVATLTVPERATITNMGAELGATTSVFPSDERTREFLAAQRREQAWLELTAESDAAYHEVIPLELSALEPLVARPHMPDNVVPVRELAGQPVDQVCIGSCTNSSLKDLMTVAAILKGSTVHPRVSLVISPGSRQVEEMIARNGALADLLVAGARVLEPACGPCIGMGQAPPSGGVSVRTFNRNFRGRSGTADASLYLTSPEMNYGQGSSREHAALAPMYLGMRAVLARSFARIHRANLINFGILPLVITEGDYERLEQGNRLRLGGLRSAVESGRRIVATRLDTDETIELTCDLSDREREIILAGGRLNYIRSRQQ